MDEITLEDFQKWIQAGLPSGKEDELPSPQQSILDFEVSSEISRAPQRRQVLNAVEEELALKNALRYFHSIHHPQLKAEFQAELKTWGKIYMHRFRPPFRLRARPLWQYPAQCSEAQAIMLMIDNNLDPDVAQHPWELITYGGNGSVFQNWAQYRLVMKYLSEMTRQQTLVLYSGHPLGLFPSHEDAPRVVITNGLMIPNYSRPEDLDRYQALGVTQYGQMTAGSFMYIGPQGIVHGTTLTLMQSARRQRKKREQNHLEPNKESVIKNLDNIKNNVSPSSTTSSEPMMLFVSSGLGGMSGAQPKAARIAGLISVVAEINPKALYKRKAQGWVQEVEDDMWKLKKRILKAQAEKDPVSIGFLGNVVDLWEFLARQEDLHVDIGSDQTSLHNPWSGGYYPAGWSFENSQIMMAQDPQAFRQQVQLSLRRQVEAICKLCDRGMFFFDYGNAFLLESSRAGARVVNSAAASGFIFPSYVEDIMGPLYFDYGFGPFRWVCTSLDPRDLKKTDQIAADIIKARIQALKEREGVGVGGNKGGGASVPEAVLTALEDNWRWICEAQSNALVVGSQARILYADRYGRVEIARAFNRAINKGELLAPVVLGRDHHDVSGTDSPYRETANIYDGSRFTADMSVQNFVGDAFRGATWVSLHNGGGVGWGEVINGGFGMLLDGSDAADRRITQMLNWDVENGLARRAWAGNSGALWAIQEAMREHQGLKVTLPY